MSKATVCCNYCGKSVIKEVGHLNRALKIGAPIYCNKKCAGLGRRNNKTIEEKKKEKSIYDKEYRQKNIEIKKQNAHEYHKTTYDPKKAAIERKKRMPKHVEYCRQPKYREYKKKYDEKYHAKKNFGEFADCFLIIKEIQKQYGDKEVRQINNLHNKSIKRKRQWKQNLNYLQLT